MASRLYLYNIGFNFKFLVCYNENKDNERRPMLSCALVTIFHIYQLLNFEKMQYWYRKTGKSSFDSNRCCGTAGEGAVLTHRLVALSVGLSVLSAPVAILDLYFQDKDDTKY